MVVDGRSPVISVQAPELNPNPYSSMVMQHVNRLILISLLAGAASHGAWAMEGLPEGAKGSIPAAEYKRNDMSLYLKSDVLKVHPTAVIMAAGSYSQKGDSYFITPHIKAPKTLYIEVLNDWVESITPPNMTTALAMPPDEMQIREPQGDVEVALPSAPASFAPVTDGMTIPNGAVVKTGSDGTAAILFGGVDSARLIPNSEAAVQQTVASQSRAAEVDLTTGCVFSKVGTQVGVKGDYEVHTAKAILTAKGTDFVTTATQASTEVWMAQGTVELVPTSGSQTAAETVTADGTGELKVLHYPPISDPHSLTLGDAVTLTALMNFIPMANQKTKSLRDKMARGVALTTAEQDYLQRIKEIPCVIKLALVEPAPAPKPKPAPLAKPTPVATTAPATPAPANGAPIPIVIHSNGTIRFQNTTMGLAELQTKLKAIVLATPDQSFAIKAGKKVAYEKIRQVLDSCRDANVAHVTAPPPPPVAAAGAPPENLPTPGLLLHPSMTMLSTNAPPMSPASAPAVPATNAPPIPAGP